MIFDSSCIVLRSINGLHVLNIGKTYEIEVRESFAGSAGIFIGILEGIITANRKKMLRIVDIKDEVFKTCIFIEDIVGINVIDS